MEFCNQSIPIDRICGLHPEVWLSVGAGFAREDVKALALAQGRGFTGDAIGSLQEICLKLTRLSGDKLLSPSARQEVLRMLLNEPRIIAELPELKRIKRQRNFVRRMDLALQNARMTFAHSIEEEVYEERLLQSVGKNWVRGELRVLTRAYEAWMEASAWLDMPILIRKATALLREGWPPGITPPQEIWSLSVQIPESLEREFWEVLGEHIQIKHVQSLNPSVATEVQITWQKWHTLDDAAMHLADLLSLETSHSDWDEHAILIPDLPTLRRSLKRALDLKNLPLADPRDPTRLRWEEAIKWATLPLEVVARNFERQKVISWLRNYKFQPEFSDWVLEINSRGIRNSLGSYIGGVLAPVHADLLALESELASRRSCKEIAEAHLKILRSTTAARPELEWLVDFFDQTWKTFFNDMECIGFGEKKTPLLFWLEKLQSRLYEASPPVARIKTHNGIKIYRLQQAPVKPVKKVWILGLPSLWLKGDGTGSYWFTEREREVLALEFAVRSSVQVHDERVTILKSWLLEAEQITVLDSQYDVDGREKESILPILKELELCLHRPFPEEPVEQGSHARYRKSYGVVRPLQPQILQLPSLALKAGADRTEITATTLDRYSRCTFQALAYHRWNLRDIREPDTELWPDVRGNILHEAVRLLLKFQDPAGYFVMLPREALNLAWKTKRPKGLIRSPRVEAYVKYRLCAILEVFCEKEKEYGKRSGARPVSLEDINFRLQYPHFAIVGQPDRIDQHEQGLFIIDYKTSGTVPHGSDMIERGYRLQLPFYAVATRKNTAQSVIGVQFVELDRKGARKSGIFFKEFNGKDPGRLTQARSNSKSLVSMSPDEVWDKLEVAMIEKAQNYLDGKFYAYPNTKKRETECARCSVADLCGYRRLVDTDEDEETSHG
jgi:RecB family exonuclease